MEEFHYPCWMSVTNEVTSTSARSIDLGPIQSTYYMNLLWPNKPGLIYIKHIYGYLQSS